MNEGKRHETWEQGIVIWEKEEGDCYEFFVIGMVGRQYWVGGGWSIGRDNNSSEEGKEEKEFNEKR